MRNTVIRGLIGGKRASTRSSRPFHPRCPRHRHARRPDGGRCHLPPPAGDIQLTGRHVAADYIQVLRYRDGLTASFNLMYDRMEMLEQLGLIPAPASSG